MYQHLQSSARNLVQVTGGGPDAVVKAVCVESLSSSSALEFKLKKKKNVFPVLTRKDSILWGASVTEY